MVAGVGPADRLPAILPHGGGREGGVPAVGVLGIVQRGHGAGHHELIEVEADLADVVVGPADGETTRGLVTASAGEVSVVDTHGAATSNYDRMISTLQVVNMNNTESVKRSGDTDDANAIIYLPEKVQQTPKPLAQTPPAVPPRLEHSEAV